jgi:hypothetical protein
MYDNIMAVLLNPRDTSLQSAQFRFWTKKMFRLGEDPEGYGGPIVIHENRPGNSF